MTKLKQIKSRELKIIKLLNLKGWDLKPSPNQYDVYDAYGRTPKSINCVVEMKFRNKYYPSKMLEKEKYDALMKLDCPSFYFVQDPKGIYFFWLNNLQMPPIVKQNCPDTTFWTNNRVLKDVYLLSEKDKITKK